MYYYENLNLLYDVFKFDITHSPLPSISTETLSVPRALYNTALLILIRL